jgi:hypothetical protein
MIPTKDNIDASVPEHTINATAIEAMKRLTAMIATGRATVVELEMRHDTPMLMIKYHTPDSRP